ncbi:MAG: sensor histidine kinase [Coriobacteriia bacterium]
MSDTRARRWPLRLAKLSPIIAVTLLLALGISLPLPLPFSLVTLAYPSALFLGEGIVQPDMDDVFLDLRAAEQANILAYSAEPEPGMFVSAAEETWQRVNVDPGELRSGDTFVSVPFAYDDEVYAPIAEWEEANDAAVWGWIVTAPEIPPIVASARGRDGAIITPQRVYVPPEYPESYEPFEPDVVDDGADAIAPALWREVHTSDSVIPALDTSMFTRGTGGGTGSGQDARLASTIVADGMAWRAITVFSIGRPDDPTAWPVVPTELIYKDPRDPGYDAWLKDLADEHEMDVWVFGPLASDAIPLRAPEGHDEAEARELGTKVWPSWYVETTGSGQVPVIAELDAPTSQLAGGPIGVMYATSWMYNSSGAYVLAGDVAPQTIAFLVVFDETPVAPPGVLQRVWYGWQDFVGRHQRPMLGAAYVLLLVSLVLSPTAFVLDRKRRVRASAADERERMQRDAHDKVYNRLSALSKRVAEVGSTATNGTAGSLGAIAEDIRTTVSELQEILGDDVEHTASALAAVPLGDQLSAVCAAQAARLGVAVSCSVPADLGQIAPELGWDLQCIAEEAITNAVRHGRAGQVRVSVSRLASGGLALSVVDDGHGSPILDASSAPEGSTGLRGIQRRVDRHAGALSLWSSDTGTTVTVTLPSV